ncbi:hypothetical protein Tco_0015503 [Tanacetum coccineum]
MEMVCLVAKIGVEMGRFGVGAVMVAEVMPIALHDQEAVTNFLLSISSVQTDIVPIHSGGRSLEVRQLSYTTAEDRWVIDVGEKQVAKSEQGVVAYVECARRQLSLFTGRGAIGQGACNITMNVGVEVVKTSQEALQSPRQCT